MLFKIECQYCGLQEKAPATALPSVVAGRTQVVVVLPAGWTADAVVVDGQEPWTLCPDSAAQWRQSLQAQRATFVASSLAKAVTLTP